MVYRKILAALLVVLLPFAAVADETILTVTHADEVTSLDLNDLEGMESVEFETTTIWTEGVQTFTGVPLSRFLEEFGISGGALKATAINDYAVTIPLADAVEGGPIIAYHRNGTPMSVRDKGPLWIVYPYDSSPAYKTEVIYSRSIWQLDRIEVIE